MGQSSKAAVGPQPGGGSAIAACLHLCFFRNRLSAGMAAMDNAPQIMKISPVDLQKTQAKTYRIGAPVARSQWQEPVPNFIRSSADVDALQPDGQRMPGSEGGEQRGQEGAGEQGKNACLTGRHGQDVPKVRRPMEKAGSPGKAGFVLPGPRLISWRRRTAPSWELREHLRRRRSDRSCVSW